MHADTSKMKKYLLIFTTILVLLTLSNLYVFYSKWESLPYSYIILVVLGSTGIFLSIKKSDYGYLVLLVFYLIQIVSFHGYPFQFRFFAGLEFQIGIWEGKLNTETFKKGITINLIAIAMTFVSVLALIKNKNRNT